jgi:hypothetical protein
MSVARSITQGFIKSPILPAAAAFSGWLRLDRLAEALWRSARRGKARRLHPMEIHEAIRVFGNSIPYEDVLVVEESALARRIAALSGRVHLPQGKHLAVTLFRTVHFSTGLGVDNKDMPWLVHELTHVWQYYQRGPRYLTDALRVQAEYGQDAYTIGKGIAEGWLWEQFNLEQQGDIAREYYRALVEGRDVSAYRRYIDVLHSVKVPA